MPVEDLVRATAADLDALFAQPWAALTALQLVDLRCPAMAAVRAAAAAAPSLKSLTVHGCPVSTAAEAMGDGAQQDVWALDFAELACLLPGGWWVWGAGPRKQGARSVWEVRAGQSPTAAANIPPILPHPCPVGDVAGLQSLDVAFTPLSCLDGMTKLAGLTRLDLMLHWTRGAIPDCSPLGALTGVRALMLGAAWGVPEWDATLQPMLTGLTDLVCPWGLPAAGLPLMPELCSLRLGGAKSGALAHLAEQAPALTRLACGDITLGPADLRVRLAAVRSLAAGRLACTGAGGDAQGSSAPATFRLAALFPRLECVTVPELPSQCLAGAATLCHMDVRTSQGGAWSAADWQRLAALPALKALRIGGLGGPSEEALDASIALCARMTRLQLHRLQIGATAAAVDRLCAGLARGGVLRRLNLEAAFATPSPAAWASLPGLTHARLDGMRTTRAHWTLLAAAPSLVRLHFAGVLEGGRQLSAPQVLAYLRQLEGTHRRKELWVTASDVADQIGQDHFLPAMLADGEGSGFEIV